MAWYRIERDGKGGDIHALTIEADDAPAAFAEAVGSGPTTASTSTPTRWAVPLDGTPTRKFVTTPTTSTTRTGGAVRRARRARNEAGRHSTAARAALRLGPPRKTVRSSSLATAGSRTKRRRRRRCRDRHRVRPALGLRRRRPANAGFKGDAGDCVTRAITIATARTYRDVYDELSDAPARPKSKGKQHARSARNGVPMKVVAPLPRGARVAVDAGHDHRVRRAVPRPPRRVPRRPGHPPADANT